MAMTMERLGSDSTRKSHNNLHIIDEVPRSRTTINLEKNYYNDKQTKYKTRLFRQ